MLPGMAKEWRKSEPTDDDPWRDLRR